jgi:hypothetical protein
MADLSLSRLRASVYFFCDEFSRHLSQPTKVQLEGSPLVWTRSTFPIVIINIMTSNSCQCMPFPIGNNTGITACCPKIPAAKKRLKKYQAARKCRKFKGLKTLSHLHRHQVSVSGNDAETQTLQVSVIICFSYSSPQSRRIISSAELQSGVWIHTCSHRTCPSATTRACDRGCHATLPLTGLHKR